MTFEERKQQVKSYLGKTVKLNIDRPIGYIHNKENYTLIYPINYGYIPGVIGGDGEELDVYLLGVEHPIKECTAKIIGIIHRENDNEDKLVAAPEGMIFTIHQIAEAVNFQEKYYITHVEALYERSAGAVLYTRQGANIKYLLIRAHHNGDFGFPKGHLEKGEDDKVAALREIFEETSVKANIIDGFKSETTYVMPNGKIKTAVYFLAEFKDQTPAHNQGFEYSDYHLLAFDEAYNSLTHQNVKDILIKANDYLKGNN